MRRGGLAGHLPLARLAIVLVVLAGASAFVLARAAAVPGGTGAFPLVGRSHAPGPVAPGVTVHRSGYDGQYYLRLAQDPFGTGRVSHGQTLDHPAYRAQRIGYPLLAWVADRLPGVTPTRALVSVNVLALGLVAWFGTGIAVRAGRSPVLGGCLALLPFAVVALARDTAEPVFVAALLGAMLAMRSGRHVWAAVALGAAVLTREQAVLAVVAAAAAALAAPFPERRNRLLPLLAVLVGAVLWQLVLTLRMGDVPVLSGPPNGGLPFAGVADVVAADLGAGTSHIVSLLIVVVLGVGLAPLLPLGRSVRAEGPRAVFARDAVPALWAASLVLAVLLTRAVWIDPNAFSRATADLMVGAVVVLASLRGRGVWTAVAALLAASAWLVVQRVGGL